jgi:hypothetical protein
MDVAFDHTAPRPIKAARSRRRPTKFEIWAWSQVLSFQIGLTGLYIALVYFGIASTIATAPAIQQTSPDGYAYFWAIALAIGAAVAAVGSISRKKKFEIVELIGSGIVSITVGSYAAIVTTIAYVLGDSGRISGSAGFTALAVPLIIRTLWLASQSRRK